MIFEIFNLFIDGKIQLGQMDFKNTIIFLLCKLDSFIYNIIFQRDTILVLLNNYLKDTTMSEWRIGNGQGWVFLNGEWRDGPEGELVPPDGSKVEYLAVREGVIYAEFTAAYRFKFRNSGGGARLLFRLQDTERYYALDVPWCGQQNRARHFWAGFVVADGTGLQKYLSFVLVPGLGGTNHQWYDVRVEARGSRLRAWIEDKLVADVIDNTYQSGRIGFSALTNPYNETPYFRDIHIEGESKRGEPWPGLIPPKPRWITPCRKVEADTYQSYANIIKSNSGDLTLYLTFGNPNECETRSAVYVRSTDGGRTWDQPQPATLKEGLGQTANFVRRDGTWVGVFMNRETPKMALYTFDSADEGRSWSGPHELNIEGGWPEVWTPSSSWRVVRMRDGALVLPIIARYGPAPVSPYSPFWTGLVLRSEDDGRTWSAPVHCDSRNKEPGVPLDPNSAYMQFAAIYGEMAIAETSEGGLYGIGRPVRDPYMWQIRSRDGGRTWEPSTVGPFPGYCPSLTRTANGALVATVRFPYFSAHVSYDDGRTWSLPVILSNCLWANQQAVEAEDNVLVITHMGQIQDPGQPDSRIARLRVMPTGLTLD
jgi:hypothetical protein